MNIKDNFNICANYSSECGSTTCSQDTKCFMISLKKLRELLIKDIKEKRKLIRKVEINDSFNSVPSGIAYRTEIIYIMETYNITEEDLK